MDNQLVLAQEGQGETVQNQMELPYPTSSDMSISQQKMRVAFANHQEARLHTLISQGHLHVGGSSFVWVDENGLLMAQDMSGELPKDPAPFFRAGPWANANKISMSLALSPHSGSQDDLGKETPIYGSLLKKLVMKELKLLPATTHLVWKKLLIDLESSSSDVYASPSVIAKKVEEASDQEDEDLDASGYFAYSFKDQDEFLCVDLDDISNAMYRLAGVNAAQSQSWATLRGINEKLANDISTLSHLANRMQTQRASPEKLLVLSDIACELRDFFLSQQWGPNMLRLLKAVEGKENKRIR